VSGKGFEPSNTNDRILSPVNNDNRPYKTNETEEINLYHVYNLNKNDLKRWIFETKSQDYAEKIIRVLEDITLNKNINLKNIKQIVSGSKYCLKYSSVSVRIFLNFCQEFEIINLEYINKVRNKVKLNIKSNIDSFVPSEIQIQESIKELYSNKDELVYLYKLMIESGIRFTELKDFLLRFNRDNIEICENVVIYRNFYIRGQKSSFYIFFSKETYTNIINSKNNLKTINYFKNHINKNKQIISLKYLRKYNFTRMIKNNVSYEIANFIQGRGSKDIGFNHYLAKKEIAVEEYRKLL
jgi:intergrase/recombinase